MGSLTGSWLSILCGNNLNVGHYLKTFQPHFFTLALVIGTVNFYHFIPLSMTLTLVGGHKISAEQNLLVSFFAHFSIDQEEILYCVEVSQAELLSKIL